MPWNEYVGYSGTGTFTQSGGTNNTFGGAVALSLGVKSGSSGTYSLGDGSLYAEFDYVGLSGSGNITQFGGTNAIYLDLILGTPVVASGPTASAGPRIERPTGNRGRLWHGHFHAIRRRQRHHQWWRPRSRRHDGSKGTYNFEGGTLITSGLNGGTAAFNFGGGTLQAGGPFTTTVPLTLTGSGGNATVDTAGYTVTFSGSLAGPGGLTKTDSGTLVLTTANTYTGDTLISGGAMQLTNARALQQSTLDSSGSGSLSFGGLTAATLGGLKGSGNLSLTNTAGAAVALTAGNNGANTTYSGTLLGSGGLTKVGAGRMILAGSNLYSGGTEVDGGTLVAANGANGSATGSGNVTLSGGTLASAASGGSISGGVQAGSAASTIAPGGIGSVATLTIGSLRTSSNLTLDFDLTAPGGSNDQLTITNSLTLAPGTPITFGTNPTTNGDYRLIGGSFGTPVLSYFDFPVAPTGMTYSLSTTVDPGYIDLVVVPEPSTFALLGVAAAGLLGYAWRRRRSS